MLLITIILPKILIDIKKITSFITTGTLVTFPAIPVNGGSAPSCQWLNGMTPIGGNSPIYAYLKQIGTWTFIFVGNRTVDGVSFSSTAALTVRK